jgi:hypothetical protein
MSTRVVAVITDLFFVARVRETAKLAGVPLEFAKTPEALEAALGGEAAATDAADAVSVSPPRFVLLDLTAGFDYERVFSLLGARGVPVLGFTTHALARRTEPWHARCARVVTKETLTQELPALLREGVGAREPIA